MSAVTYSQLVRGNRDFRYFWGGQIVSQLGDWFSAITVQALLLQYTGSVTALAGFQIAAMLPGFLLGPVAGVVVDRFSRKQVMIAADLVRALVALGLLLMRGPETVWVGYLCVAGLSTFAAFFEPARVATLPNITSDEELVTANALSSVTWSVLLTSGALVGGLVGRFFGTDTAFVLNAVSFIGSALLIYRIHLPHERHGTHASGWGELLAGFRYVRARREIMAALSAKFGWGIAGGLQVLLPVYGARVFPLPHDPGGQLGISLLFAAGGLGTALGPVLARRFTGRELPRLRWAIALSFLLGGFYILGVAAAPSLALVALFLCLSRMHGAIVWVFSTVLLQVLTEDRYRGRVFAAEMSLFTGTMMLSGLGTARALDLGWGSVPQLTVLMAAVSITAGIVWTARLARGGAGGPA